MRINVWAYLSEYKKEKKAILLAVEKVFSSGQLILGENVQRFEEEFSAYCKRSYGIGTNSGTDAIFLALKALGIGKGDEVITVPNTAIPTVSAICTTGASPVFVDIDPGTYLIDVNKIESKITKRTKCILPVHLFGQCCDMGAIFKIAKKHKLFVLEDCAQAHGAMWGRKIAGSMSDLAAFSFYPTKILGAYGDGGMVVTNSLKLTTKIKMSRMYGISKDYYSEFLGYNSRLDEVQAAILRYKLKRIDGYLLKRKKIAERYYSGLANTSLKLPTRDLRGNHAFYLFVCRHKMRDRLLEYLKDKDIHLNVSYRYPIHLMKGFAFLGYKKRDFPVTETAAEQIFSLPMYPEFSIIEQNRVIEVLKQFSSNHPQ